MAIMTYFGYGRVRKRGELNLELSVLETDSKPRSGRTISMKVILKRELALHSYCITQSDSQWIKLDAAELN